MSARSLLIVRKAIEIAKNNETEQKQNLQENDLENCATEVLPNFSEDEVNNVLSPEDYNDLINNAELIVSNDNTEVPTSENSIIQNTVLKPVENVIIEIVHETVDFQCGEKESSLSEEKENELNNDKKNNQCGEKESSLSEEKENESDNDKKNKRNKGNKRQINKTRRMLGKSYIGFSKPRNQRNTFHNTQRSERKMGERCKCKVGSYKCNEFSEDVRTEIFTQLWQLTTWDQRATFVANTVVVVEPKKRRNPEMENIRRGNTLKYNLWNNNRLLPVCKTMYLNTTGLKEWSVRNWATQSKSGVITNQTTKVRSRPSRTDIHQEDREFMVNFLDKLPKLPSHYCRKSTNKLYLEETFKTITDVYNFYKKQCEEFEKKSMSLTSFMKKLDEKNIGIFTPRKDKCDLCEKYKHENLGQEEWNKHWQKKIRARREKDIDKEKAESGACHVITVDLQAVKLSPQTKASALYYKTKLCCHNYTIYDLESHDVVCYWFDETNADLQASTFASCLVDVLKEKYLSVDKKPIIIYSDGCTAQNRNAIISNALLYLAEKYDVCITQKFLEKGHTQMECDSVHAAIERKLKNQDIYLPYDYARVCEKSRKKQKLPNGKWIQPYQMKCPDYSFFINYGEKENLKYESIRPGTSVRDPTVTELRAIQYLPSGDIFFKVDFEEDFKLLPRRAKNINLKECQFRKLFSTSRKITKRKFDDLQEIKLVIPKDCWPFYDALQYNK